MEHANVDLIGPEGVQGLVAAQIQQEGRLEPGAMRPFFDRKTGKAYVTVYKGSGDRAKKESYITLQAPVTNGTLRRDEWKRLDEAILEISRTRLNGVQDLIDKGLTYQLGDGMGSTVLEYHDVSDALVAELTMDGVTRAKGDRVKYSTIYLPIPIIHADYEINARVLAASRKLGNPLDTTMAERATRKVAEQLETMLFTATSYAFGGGTIYSYLNHPNRNTGTLSASWSTDSPAGILEDVIAMKQASINAMHYGPWMLYIPTAYETVLDEDYVSTTSVVTTIRKRLMDIEGIMGIKVVDTLTADNVVMVQMTSDVVRLVQGMGVQSVEWETEGKFITKHKVLTIQVPQIRADQDGNSGIMHYSV